jgi:hypothetical protein
VYFMDLLPVVQRNLGKLKIFLIPGGSICK